MRKVYGIFIALFLVSSVSGFANNVELSETISVEKTLAVKNENASQQLLFDECSVTSSGTATTSDGTVVNLTITVTGPCNASIAQKMRDEIRKLRAEISQI